MPCLLKKLSSLTKNVWLTYKKCSLKYFIDVVRINDYYFFCFYLMETIHVLCLIGKNCDDM